MLSRLRSLAPLAVIVATLLAAPVLVTVATRFDGSFTRLAHADGWREVLRNATPTPAAIAAFLAFLALQTALLVLLPGPRFTPPNGDEPGPSYRLNGLPALVITHGLIVASWAFGRSPAWIYDHLGGLLSSASLFALGLCTYVHVRAQRWSSSTGPLASRFFWGVERHPHVANIELKQLCNCRLSMMGWSVLVVAYLAKQHALLGHVSSAMAASAGLQLVYVLGFFASERTYLGSFDVVHDRFGYYLGWGVLCWLPTLYPIAPLYLVEHPGTLGGRAPSVLALGLGAIAIKASADRERARVRRGGPNVTIWGKTPQVFDAHYIDATGHEHASALLASGWWGVARHFRYLPEMVLAIAWTLPCGAHDLLPWLYPTFLAVLLVHRVGRVEARCAAKYGADWARYVAAVPYRLIPGVY